MLVQIDEARAVEVDLRELSELPFGQAEERLREMGLWRTPEDQLKTFIVDVDVTVSHHHRFEVEAGDENEAREKAEEEAADEHAGDHFDVDILSVTEKSAQ